MKLSHYQLKHFFLSFLMNPDNEGNTIEINVNININGTNGKYPASGNGFTPEFK